jgi:hypothetical protein
MTPIDHLASGSFQTMPVLPPPPVDKRFKPERKRLYYAEKFFKIDGKGQFSADFAHYVSAAKAVRANSRRREARWIYMTASGGLTRTTVRNNEVGDNTRVASAAAGRTSVDGTSTLAHTIPHRADLVHDRAGRWLAESE